MSSITQVITPNEPHPLDEAGYDRRRSLRLLIWSFIFAQPVYSITGGVALTQFARLTDLPAGWFGFMAAIPFLGYLMQLPSSYFASRLGKRKPIVIAMGLFDRSLWLAIAIIPWILPAGAWRWGGLLVMLLILHLTLHIATPLHTSWQADIVPRQLRGRFYGRMKQIGLITSFAIVLLVGWVLDAGEKADGDWFLVTLSGLFAVAAVFGMLEILSLVPISDPLPNIPNPSLRIGTLIAGPLRDRAFLNYLGFTSTVTLANICLSGYATLYLINEVKLSNQMINLFGMVLPTIVMIPAFPFWGKLIDRIGRRPVLILSMLLVAPAGGAYALMRPDNWMPLAVLIVLMAACYCGYELAVWAWALSFGQSKDGKTQGSHYLAVASMCTAIVGLIGGVAIGQIVSWIGENWQGTLFGVPLTYHAVLLFLSTALRLISITWLLAGYKRA